jgi:hypothetical protein
MKTEEEKEPATVSTRYDDKYIRCLSLLIFIAVIVADYMGYVSKYSDYVLGITATAYIFGRKGLMLILGKKLGYDKDELKDFLD